MKIYLLHLCAVLLLPISARAASLNYLGRCDLSSPPLNISLEKDPRQLVVCTEKKGKPHISFSEPFHLVVGAQSYPVRQEWPSVESGCAGAIKLFKDYPEVFFDDPVTGLTVLVNANEEFELVRITYGARRDACRGKVQ